MTELEDRSRGWREGEELQRRPGGEGVLVSWLWKAGRGTPSKAVEVCEGAQQSVLVVVCGRNV